MPYHTNKNLVFYAKYEYIICIYEKLRLPLHSIFTNTANTIILLQIFMKHIFTLCLLIFAILMPVKGDNYISPTHYNYSNVSHQLTTNCTTDLEKARAIYDWICENISYDTNYRIYTADECWDNRKGVCQAYCELFYRLCEPLGIECIIISGESKDIYGNIGSGGHAWVYAKVDDGAILLDPTWGAGYVNNGVFERRTDHSDWFQIDPYWMIFSHFPKDERFQFIDQHIDFNTFKKLPPLRPNYRHFGWKARDLFRQCLTGEITSIPQFYSDERSKQLALFEIPMQKTLKAHHTYHFEIARWEGCEFCEFAIYANNRFYYMHEFEYNEGIFSMDIVPTEGEELSIMLKVESDVLNSTYSTVVSYQISHSAW